MAHKNPNISKTSFFLNPKFWRTTLFIEDINICEIQYGEKSLRMDNILGKNLEESLIFNFQTELRFDRVCVLFDE
jgi:hypothetical protein